MILALMSSAAPAPAVEIACRAGGVPADAIELREAPVNVVGLGEGDQAMAYVSFLTPADWKDEGIVSLDAADGCGVTEKARWRAEAPDGSVSIAMTPGEGWTASARPGQFSACASRDIHDAEGYAKALLASEAPGAAVEAVRERPDIADPIRRLIAAPEVYGETLTISAAEIAFTMADENGPVQGLLVTAMAAFTPHPAIPEFETRATAFPSMIVQSRKGAPDPAFVEMVRASAIANPNWVRLRERMLAAPALTGDPRDRITGRFEKLPFPKREAGEPVAACGSRFAPLKTPNVWRSEDGRTWFSSALSGALETAR
ncbi:MAG: hypothetical protein ACK4NP_11355 [Parvularculaceae bacterium]